jgi:hypothetical protein
VMCSLFQENPEIPYQGQKHGRQGDVVRECLHHAASLRLRHTLPPEGRRGFNICHA